jgi:mono/diheme cytochrome c family protein
MDMMNTSLLLITTLAAPLAFGVAAQQQSAPESNPFEGDAGVIAEGHSLFNETCSHCHGPDAQTPISERNLRKLKVRYGDQMTAVFHTTVEEGRPDMGMPTWGGVIDETTLWKIYTYLESIQVGE